MLPFRFPQIEGDGAPTRRTAWIARPEVARFATGPGREASRPAPCGAPTGIFGLRLLNGRTDQELFVPGRVLPERRPWVGLRHRLPAGALPLPALRTPPEGAPRTRIGMGST